MTDKESKPIDTARMARALEELAAKPNPKMMTKEDYLRKPEVYASLMKAWHAGYRASDIVPTLKAEGFEIAAPTFEIYWRRIRKEMGDGNETEPNAKPQQKVKVRKSAETSAATLPKSEMKQGDRNPPKPDSKPAGAGKGTAGGKPLSKPTDMGGAFSDDV